MTGALACLNITVSAGVVTLNGFSNPGLTVAGSWSTIAGTVWSQAADVIVTFTSTTARTITSGGVQFPGRFIFNGAGGTWTLQDDIFVVTLVIHIAGTLELGSFVLSTRSFGSTGTTARTINFGFGGKSAKGKIMRIKKNNPERRKSFRARHNCDRAQGVGLAERNFMCYTPERHICQHAESIGFESTFSHNGSGDLSWLEFKRPGEISSIRGGQTLAKVLARSK